MISGFIEDALFNFTGINSGKRAFYSWDGGHIFIGYIAGEVVHPVMIQIGIEQAHCYKFARNTATRALHLCSDGSLKSRPIVEKCLLQRVTSPTVYREPTRD